MNEIQLKYYKLTTVSKRDLDEGIWDEDHKGLYSKDGKRFLKYQPAFKGNGDVFTFKPGVEVICEKAFEYGTYLKGFKLPDTIVAIGSHALSHVMRNGERLVIPKGMKFFGNHIFGNSEGVFDVEFEEGFKEVDFGNVMDFAAATSIYIPSTMESIGNNGFGAVNFAIAIYAAKESKYFCTVDDVLYDYDKTKLFRCPAIKRGKLIVPEGVTAIVKYAFRFCGADIDSSTTGIAKMSVVLPQSLECIEMGAFRHSHLCSLYIGPNVHTIEDDAFKDHFIKEITVSSENPYYESYHGMLIDKRTMRLITISGNFTGQDIHHKWFEVKNNVLIDKKRKTALLTVGYSDDGSNSHLAVWDEDEALPGINYSKDLEIPEGIEIVNGGAFSHGSFHNIVIPEGVTYIGDCAFDFTYAKTVSLPSTLCYLTPSTIHEICNRGFYENEFSFLVPKGMTGKYIKMGIEDWAIRKYFKEVETKDTLALHVDDGTDDDNRCAMATDADMEETLLDKSLVRYSKDGKRLLKFEGFRSRFSSYAIADGTEIVCNNATATDRYQYVRTFTVPSSMKYVGSSPSFDRMLICGSHVRFAPSSISLRKNDTVYIPCGTWNFYVDELEKARRGKAPSVESLLWDKVEDYRLVELSRASVAMYLKQQLKVLTDIIRTTKLISEYTVTTINGDLQKRYVCYRDRNRVFFLNADNDSYQRDYIRKVLSALGISYQKRLGILEVDIDKIKVNKRNQSLLCGRTLADSVMHYWDEEFIDEDSGEVIPIQRGEIVYYRGTKLDEHYVQTLLDLGIPSVSVVHGSNSYDVEYLNYYTGYWEEQVSPIDNDSILRHFFPDKKPKCVTEEEKNTMGYNLVILVKSMIDNYGYVEDKMIPLRTNNGDLHGKVSIEEERLALLIAEYYGLLIDKVMNCRTESEVMPLFPETQGYLKMKEFLICRGVSRHLIDSLVAPIMGIIQVE